MPTPDQVPAPDRVMYHGTVRRLPLAGQLRAAALAGCTDLTTGPGEYLALRNDGLSTRDMKAMAADAGIRIDHVDALVRWIPALERERPAGASSAGVQQEADDFFRIADALEARSFGVVGLFAPGTIGDAALIDAFGALCARAARHGMRCDLEFMPLGGIPDLAAGWRIVEGANAPNSGLVIDLWHYNRSDSSDDLLRSIPGDRISRVQLDDGTAARPRGVSLPDDTLNRRVPPGAGEMRVREVIAVLRETGGLNRVGPEIMSAAFDPLPAEEIAEICRTSAAWALDVA